MNRLRLLLTLACLLAARPALAAPQLLHGHVPAAVHQLAPLHAVAATQTLKLAIGLPLRNQAQLSTLLQQLYDPSSPSFHQFLTPAQFTAQFGPTPADYQAVIDFATAHNLKVTRLHPNRIIVDVEGAVPDVEKAFHVHLNLYRHPTENRNFFSPDTEPSLDLAVPILHIGGLSDFYRPHPRYHIRPPQFAKAPATSSGAPLARPASANQGSASDGGYVGNDFRSAYVPGTSLTGSGQSIGLLEFDNCYAADIASYKSQYHLPDVPVIIVNVGTGVSTPGINNDGGGGEVALDVEMALSMAPGVSAIYLYETSDLGFSDLLSQMADDNVCHQLSASWGQGGTDPNSESALVQMQAQGQSFFAASGDSDALVSNTNQAGFPEDSVNLTSVGATSLFTNSAGGSFAYETVWNWDGNVGSSGGISPFYPIPNWQKGVSMSSNGGSTTMRDLPDVAMCGDNVEVDYNSGSNGIFGGTSCAAPLWAAFTALLNQQAIPAGRGPIGFANPLIYQIGKSSSYSTGFNDVTQGNNDKNGASGYPYAAVTGYDLCTGWGSPTGSGLINLLASPGDSLQVSPVAPFNATGPVGGSFSPSSYVYTLSNTGSTTIGWTANDTQSWVTLSAHNGTLAAGGSTAITVSFNTRTPTLANGSYTNYLTFTDTNSSVTQERFANLTVTAPAPTVTTGSATSIALNSATLNGSINPNSLDGAGWFQWGTTTSYGNTSQSISSDNGGNYSSWSYGSNAGTGFGPATYLEGNFGGIYLATSNNGNRQIDGSNSFAVYPSSGGQALYRQLTLSGGVGTLNFSARFDLSNAVAFSGFNIKSAAGSHFGDNELLSFGLTPFTGNQSIFVGGSNTQTIPLGTEIRGAVVDFQLIWDANQGTYQLGARIQGSGSYTTVSGTLKSIGATPYCFGIGNFNTGNNQNLIFNSLLLTTAESFGITSSSVAYTLPIGGLSPGTTYHFRAVGSNSNGTTYGPDQTFNTLGLPVATTNAATAVASWTSTLNGLVNPEGYATTCYFELGTTGAYGFATVSQSAGSGSGNVPVSFLLTGLEPGTTYHYRLDAVNSFGATTGSDQTFTTSSFVSSLGDGIADDWALYFFGTTRINPSDTPSGSTYTNLQNYIAGTDPLNAAAQLHCSVSLTGTTGAQITFNSLAGKLYRVQYSSTLASPSWVTLQDQIPGTGGNITVSDPTFGAPRFYEVVVYQ